MTENIEEQLNESDIEYIIVSKNKDDILDELDFENEEERLLCDSIITNLEKTASDNIRSMKTVQLPFIGCIRINPVKRKLRDSKLHLKEIRKSLTKEQYKEHVRSIVIDLKEKQKDNDRTKLILHKLKSTNKKHYEKLFTTCGKEYAELYIMSIYWLKEVPYNEDFENYYKTLKD